MSGLGCFRWPPLAAVLPAAASAAHEPLAACAFLRPASARRRRLGRRRRGGGVRGHTREADNSRCRCRRRPPSHRSGNSSDAEGGCRDRGESECRDESRSRIGDGAAAEAPRPADARPVPVGERFSAIAAETDAARYTKWWKLHGP